MPDIPAPIIIVRGEGSGEAARISAAVDEAFPDPRLRSLIGNLRRSPYFRAELSCVAVRGSELVGYVIYFPVMVQAVGQATKAVHMSPIAVRNVPDRQGIGERLVRHGIQRAHSLGFEVVLVMGPANYFGSFGFLRATPLGFKASLPIPDESFLVHMMRPELMGQVHGQVLYPPGVFTA
ncbi:MAG: N-acetyltransferase [Elusimicrobia bacterium]|nr:N-acetyltransferase [Elusimicrobiota bacterium]